MKYGLNLGEQRAEQGAPVSLDLLSLGALVHRLDPGIVPWRKATECQIHVSGGEFNVSANLADCFGLRTGVASAMVDYPIGDLIAERVRAMGVVPLYRRFQHNGVTGPNMATVYSDRGQGVRAPVVFYNREKRRRPNSSPAISTGTPSSPVGFAGCTAAGSLPRCRRRRANSSSRPSNAPGPPGR